MEMVLPVALRKGRKGPTRKCTNGVPSGHGWEVNPLNPFKLLAKSSGGRGGMKRKEKERLKEIECVKSIKEQRN